MNTTDILNALLGGAVVVTLFGYRIVLRRCTPLLEPRFRIPGNRRVDARLIVGAALFGVGWGLVGYCPGPAIASLAFGMPEPVLFIAAMAAGMLIAPRAERVLTQAQR